MTTEAQSALRKTMEDNSTITRFCFICNYINQITTPIKSRCAIFRFKPLDEKSIISKLSFIAKKENLKLKKESMNIITNIVRGDMRKAIMLLQNLQYVNHGKIIEPEHVYEIASCINKNKLKLIEQICIDNKTDNINKIVELTDKIKSVGYPMNNVINRVNYMIITNEKLSDKQKSYICLHLAKTEKRLIDGADEFLQLLSIFMCIKSISMNHDTIYKKLNF